MAVREHHQPRGAGSTAPHGLPRVFILIRDYGESCFEGFREFKQHIAEVNFLDPKDREEADLDDLLTEAWNFLALTEEEEENLYEANNGYQDDEF